MSENQTFRDHCETCRVSDDCKAKDCMITVGSCIKIDKEEITRLKEENAQLKDEASRKFPRVCHWSEDDDGYWESSCGLEWVLNEGTAKENDMNYCPKCGAVLVERLYDAEKLT